MRVSQDDVRNAIGRYFREHGGSRATVTTLALLLGHTENQVRVALDDLRARGVIKRRRTPGPIIGANRWRYEYSMAKQEAQ